MQSSRRYRIGIVGCGVVGQAVRATCTPDKVELLCCFDRFRHERSQNVDRMGETDIVFLCLPTPTKQMKQQRGALMEALEGLVQSDYQGVIVVKSTVLPGTMDYLKEVFPLRLVHNPEFLSERSAELDYRSQHTALLSGDEKDCELVADFLERTTLTHLVVSDRDYRVTEHAKYLHNCMLAVQLSFLNEVHDLIGNQGVYDRAVAMAAAFGNVGPHHAVPGPDGKQGWGGMCFPKDTMAYLCAASRDLPTLRGAVTTNILLRPEEMPS